MCGTGRALSDELSLAALFTASFLAATLLPGGSEAVLYAVLKAHPETYWSALGLATLGNTLGGLTSYAVGRLIPGQPAGKAHAIARRYGTPALLLSWVPLIGDALCIAAGWLRLRLAPATLFIAAGKFARYVGVAALAV
jgi:membrane protein YqaA with SNARE-associated domain